MFASKWNGWLRRHVRRMFAVGAVLVATFAGSAASRGQSSAVDAVGPAGSELWREHPVVARALAAAEREPSFTSMSTGGAESLLPLSPASRLRSL